VGLELRRLRQSHARQHFIPHSCVIHERGDDGGSLLKVRFLNGFEHIHVRVMRARLVVDWVLDELKGGQPDVIEVEVVGAADTLYGQRRGAEIAEWPQPDREDRSDGFISLDRKSVV